MQWTLRGPGHDSCKCHQHPIRRFYIDTFGSNIYLFHDTLGIIDRLLRRRFNAALLKMTEADWGQIGFLMQKFRTIFFRLNHYLRTEYFKFYFANCIVNGKLSCVWWCNGLALRSIYWILGHGSFHTYVYCGADHHCLIRFRFRFWFTFRLTTGTVFTQLT